MPHPDSETIPRPPVIAVMGHIDHGKSSLLDHIRKSKVVESEAGGITQHLSAYEVEHTAPDGAARRITFLDTPGHEAFKKMRTRGSAAADIAILIVSAEDGAKPQTIEAYEAIAESGIPFCVALSKIDKPSANVERAKSSLLERGIYLEGMGGDIPFVAISSKTGEGISELLDVVLLLADLAELVGNPNAPAEGIIIESHTDPKVGIAATMIVKNGTLRSGEFVVAGAAYAPTRIMTDFRGKTIKEAGLSKPVTVSGFTGLPQAGTAFAAVPEKRIAEDRALEARIEDSGPGDAAAKKKITVPLIIKADFQGSLEAIEHELAKRENDDVSIHIVQKGVGAITENDVKFASGADRAGIVGFNVTADAAAHEWARRLDVELPTFSVIYKIGEWVDERIAKAQAILAETEPTGTAVVLKIFSAGSQGQLIGARVERGTIKSGNPCAIIRNGEEIGRGSIDSLKSMRTEVDEIGEHKEFGALVDVREAIAAGDVLQSLPKKL